MSDLIANPLSEYNITYLPKKGLRRVNLRISPAGEISVSYPKRLKKSVVDAFLIEKEDWIKKKVNRITLNRPGQLIVPGFSISANQYLLKWQLGERSTSLNGLEYVFFYPGTENQFDATSEEMRKDLEKVLKKIAKPHFERLSRELAIKFTLPFNNFRISSAKARWGSCSYQNNLSISCYAIFLSEELQEHLILHELCHTKEKNHGLGFHRLLASISLNAKTKERTLRSSQIPYFC